MSVDKLQKYFQEIPKVERVDYIKLYDTNPIHAATRYLFECGVKLEIKQTTIAIAALFFHKVFKNMNSNDYDRLVFAISCLYLAGKVNDDPVKIRDVINVSQTTLKRDSPVLQLGNQYWAVRDSIVQTELLIVRALRFDINISNDILPHSYLLHYITSLSEWFGDNTFSEFPIARTAFSVLQDFFHNPSILNYKPTHIAVSCLFFALQVYGIKIPHYDETDTKSDAWFMVFVKDITTEKIWEIVEQIIKVYEIEENVSSF